MSNLAQKFLNAGFLTEAEEICNRAIKLQDYHKNVGSTLSRIKGLPESEANKLGEIQAKAVPVSDFLRDYGHALTKEALGPHESTWQGKRCELTVTISGNSFRAEGSYEVSWSGLLALALTGGPPSEPKKIKYFVKYDGSIVGKAIKATVTVINEENKSKTSTIFGGGGSDSTKTVKMILSDSLDEIRVYEKSEKEDEFYTFKRLS